ncbi:MAG TPA: peptide deformylase [Thermoanaerobaculia bacterium]|nr:peptide deformylase [Thermoanaerobaculia bacterium]
MILKVSRLGHPVLRQKSSAVEIADVRKGKFRRLVDDMFETMHAYQGVGLAGPQVHLPIRVFVYELGERVAERRNAEPLPPAAVFNATYEPLGGDRITDWEGCLSVPFLGGECPRYRSIRVRGVDAAGEPFESVIEGYAARIFQHEIDHTDGQVYLDRMPDLRTLGYTLVL